jgi:glycosyltransferase involved in cell wall biosynthesis
LAPLRAAAGPTQAQKQKNKLGSAVSPLPRHSGANQLAQNQAQIERPCELVQDGETGWLVPAGIPVELALRLRGLIHDYQEREAMGIAGRQRALLFSVSRMVEQAIAVYDGVWSRYSS